MAAVDLYPDITAGKFYRQHHKRLKHTLEKYIADVPGPDIETTIDKDGQPIPGCLSALYDPSKLVPLVAHPVPPVNFVPISSELHLTSLTFPPGPPLDVGYVEKKQKEKRR